MQSGFCASSQLEMARKRVKTFIFKNEKKIKNEKVDSLNIVSTRISLLLEKQETFFKQSN